MIIRYDSSKVSRGLAWARACKIKPVYEHEGLKFSPQQHDLRKDHTDTHWSWIVGAWRPCDREPREGAPCPPPPPITDSRGTEFQYGWATWTDKIKLDTHYCCGFILDWVLRNKRASTYLRDFFVD